MSSSGHRTFSFGRIAAITANTFTELTRLKTFYVLLVFALLLIGNSVFVAQLTFQEEFQVLKDIALGAMSIFTSLLAILATARLIPQDTEDRTLYTILAKPVARIEYLLGKLAGVLFLLAISLIIMSALFFVVLKVREQSVLSETMRQMQGSPPNQMTEALSAVRASAFGVDLFPGIGIIYVKACLLAALTLFISTFATTTIFTTVLMVFVYFIGHLQSTARAYWLQTNSAGWVTKLFLAFVALFFPDLQLFNLVDDIVAGNAIPLALFIKTTTLGFFYTGFYLLLAWSVFYRKEL
jgi:ABC-type Na+ efflux pump permease subunit